jgi:hypothetical protein
MTKLELLVTLMDDGGWHSTNDLVSRVGHRFSATKYVAEKQGYRFDQQRNGQNFEYRMLKNLAADVRIDSHTSKSLDFFTKKPEIISG